MIDIHAHVTDNLQQRLAQDAELGTDITILSATRVHPERAHTTADVRAEFAALQKVISGDSSIGSFDNAKLELQQAMESAPLRTRALAAVPLWLERELMLSAVADQLQRPGYVGIGELTPAPGAAGVIEPVIELAADHNGLPVLVHGFAPNTEADIRTYAELARRYPTVPIIIGAFGGLNAMLAVDLAGEVANVHLDLSSALQAFVVAAALREIPHKCMYGSNTPYGVPAAALATIKACSHDPSIEHRILHDNAANLFALASEDAGQQGYASRTRPPASSTGPTKPVSSPTLNGLLSPH